MITTIWLEEVKRKRAGQTAELAVTESTVGSEDRSGSPSNAEPVALSTPVRTIPDRLSRSSASPKLSVELPRQSSGATPASTPVSPSPATSVTLVSPAGMETPATFTTPDEEKSDGSLASAPDLESVTPVQELDVN